MGATFWIKRFLLALSAIFVVLLAAHLLRGRDVRESVIQAAIWAPVTAAIYIYVAIRKSRQCAACAVAPQVSPPLRQENRGPDA
jgi:hypothetical protein